MKHIVRIDGFLCDGMRLKVSHGTDIDEIESLCARKFECSSHEFTLTGYPCGLGGQETVICDMSLRLHWIDRKEQYLLNFRNFGKIVDPTQSEIVRALSCFASGSHLLPLLHKWGYQRPLLLGKHKVSPLEFFRYHMNVEFYGHIASHPNKEEVLYLLSVPFSLTETGRFVDDAAILI